MITRPRRKRRVIRRKVTPRARRGVITGARAQLRRFRQGSLLAVALTGLLLLLVPEEARTAAEPAAVTQADPEAGQEPAAPADDDAGEPDPPAPRPEELGRETRRQATGTVVRLWNGFLLMFPRMLVALAALVVAALVSRLVRFALRMLSRQWERAQAMGALAGIAVWVLALGVALSVLAGDVRALVGSLGLVGLALSWALQAPIESFTGWLLNSFRGYYKRGDRIVVAEVFGDVYKIDLLTTTVWEIGGPFRPGFVHAEQATGRLVTFPNSEVLTGSVVNLTRDFPYVWDELAIPVANESDLRLAIDTLGGVARELLGARMQEPAHAYAEILARAGLENGVPGEPQVFVTPAESWTDVVIRYLVGARERRLWKSELYLATTEALRAPSLVGKVLPVYPRHQVQLVTRDGAPSDLAPLSAAPGRG